MKEAERETRLATISPCSGLTESPWRFPWNILSVSSPLALAVLFEASMILTWHRAWSSLNRNPLNHHNSEKLSEMSTFKIILINFNIIFPMCRMMAPMGNGDLGHHPEKMLPPPEAPDIQVDIVKKNSNRTIFYDILSDFPHKQQGACGWRPRRKPLWRLEALRLRGGIELNDCWNIFQPRFSGRWELWGLVVLVEFRHRWCRPWVWIPPQLWTEVFNDDTLDYSFKEHAFI